MRQLGKVEELAGSSVVLSWSLVVVVFCRTQHHCGMGVQPSIMQRSGISHLAERRSEKPGATLTRVRLHGAARGFFSLPESTFSADSLTVSVQPPCAIAFFNNVV